MPRAGRFFVFEGIDGSGTSTQADRLRDALAARGEPAVRTEQPSPGPIGRHIRLLLGGEAHVSDDDAVFRRHLAYLFAADRHEHLFNDAGGIAQRLAAGEHVISTRYTLSSFVYNADGDDERRLVAALNEPFPLPDTTFFLDCPVEESLRRIAADGRAYDRHENEATLRRVASRYEEELERYAGPVVRIDATASPDDVHGRVLAAL